MTRRDRAERARVVVEADRVIETRSFGGELAETAHAFRRIVEPPRWSEPQYWVVPRERREFARIGSLVEREQDERQVALVAEAVEQGFQRAHIIGSRRNVGAHVAA